MSNWFENHHAQRTQISTRSLRLLSKLEESDGLHCWPQPLVFQAYSFNSNSIRGIIQTSAHRASLMTKTTLIFPAFSLRFEDFAVHFCCRCKFSFYGKPFKSSLTVAWFSWTNRNSLLRIVTNEIAFASLCIDNRIRQMAFFMLAKAGKGLLSSNS